MRFYLNFCRHQGPSCYYLKRNQVLQAYKYQESHSRATHITKPEQDIIWRGKKKFRVIISKSLTLLSSQTEMAQVSICRAVALVLFIAALLSMTAVVSARDVDLAPSPSMDAGAAFPVTVSAGFVCSSLFFSVIVLLLQ